MPWTDWLPFATRKQLHDTERRIMAHLDDVLSTVSDQLEKSSGEILGALDQLQAEVKAGQPSQATLDRLRAAAQALDDIVPDAENQTDEDETHETEEHDEPDDEEKTS